MDFNCALRDIQALAGLGGAEAARRVTQDREFAFLHVLGQGHPSCVSLWGDLTQVVDGRHSYFGFYDVSSANSSINLPSNSVR